MPMLQSSSRRRAWSTSAVLSPMYVFSYGTTREERRQKVREARAAAAEAAAAAALAELDAKEGTLEADIA